VVALVVLEQRRNAQWLGLRKGLYGILEFGELARRDGEARGRPRCAE
jgi:hypothetical protein